MLRFFFQTPILSHFLSPLLWDSNFTYVRPFNSVSHVSCILLYVIFFSFLILSGLQFVCILFFPISGFLNLCHILFSLTQCTLTFIIFLFFFCNFQFSVKNLNFLIYFSSFLLFQIFIMINILVIKSLSDNFSICIICVPHPLSLFYTNFQSFQSFSSITHKYVEHC